MRASRAREARYVIALHRWTCEDCILLILGSSINVELEFNIVIVNVIRNISEQNFFSHIVWRVLAID